MYNKINNVFVCILIVLSLIASVCSYINPSRTSVKELAFNCALLSIVFAVQETFDQLNLKHTKNIKEV
ncbi:hypothetical protein DW952_17420 [Ruminococcus sp. AM44-9AT]|jgi:hypothetical protein|nr:hypothetical protein DW952_17420 [Ruminococcus sp. AM44-9AT]